MQNEGGPMREIILNNINAYGKQYGLGLVNLGNWTCVFAPAILWCVKFDSLRSSGAGAKQWILASVCSRLSDLRKSLEAI